MNPIRIGLADDHNLFRGGIIQLLLSDPHLDVRIETSSGTELLEKMARHKIDVVLTDISMPDMGGIQVAKIISRDFKGIVVVALSMHDHPSYIKKMMAAGAKGYVLKSADPTELIACIKEVYAGNMFFCKESTKTLFKDVGLTDQTVHEMALSDRDKEVLKLIFDEYSDAEIAEKLKLSQKTTVSRKKGLMKKLGVKSIVGLVKRIIQDGLF